MLLFFPNLARYTTVVRYILRHQPYANSVFYISCVSQKEVHRTRQRSYSFNFESPKLGVIVQY